MSTFINKPYPENELRPNLECSVRELLAAPAKPVRDVRAMRRASGMMGMIFCEKGGGRCDAESLGEFRLSLAMRDDPTILAFRCQPETFRWAGRDDARHRYTPDFVVLMLDGALVYREVKKLADYMDDPSLEGRKDDIVSLCRSRGAAFEIWTDVGPRRGRVDGGMMCRERL